jgi:hypothetical protein
MGNLKGAGLGNFQAENVAAQIVDADGLAGVEDAGVVKAKLSATFTVAEFMSVDRNGLAIAEVPPMGQIMELGYYAFGDLALGLAQGGLQVQKVGIAGANGYEGDQAKQGAANH